MTNAIYSTARSSFKMRLAAVLVVTATILGINFMASQRASAVSLPAPVIAAADQADKCNRGVGFFGLEPWYHFMPNELGVPANGDNKADPCGVRCFNLFVQHKPNDCGETKSDIPGIVLAVIDDLLRVAGLVAVAFIIVGAFQYVGSRGNSERTSRAQSTISDALIGLIVALLSVALVSFIGGRLVN